MNRDEALQLVCNAIAQIQTQSGRAIDVLTENSRPFVDVDGFDSLNGEEVTALLLEDISFGGDINPFDPADDGGLRIGDIADRIAACRSGKMGLRRWRWKIWRCSARFMGQRFCILATLCPQSD